MSRERRYTIHKTLTTAFSQSPQIADWEIASLVEDSFELDRLLADDQ